MKVTIEAIGTKTGGGAEVTLNLLRSLSREQHDVVALLPDIPRYAESGESASCVIRFPAGASLLRRHLILTRELPRICKRERTDVLFCLGNFPPSDAPCPTVAVVQNALYVCHDPATWSRLTVREKLIARYGRRLLAARTNRAHLVVQTKAMKRRLACLPGGDESRISVIPTPAYAPGPVGGAAANTDTRAAFTFLCLSRYAAHKNFEILLDAAQIARKLTRRPFRCLLTTNADEHPGARKLLKRIERDGLDDLIVNIGPVPRERIADAYAQADAHLLPTLLESYGLTYDEAMHFGLPILTSDRDFARERCQDAAIYFDPLDAESVAKAMARVMEDADLRAQLVANGKRIVAAAPTWEEIAARFVDVLERVAAGRPLADPEAELADPFVRAAERAR